ncbi:hypothetical protein E1A91_A05G358800v1 [Gossypium mustelinum]|uniref:Uncharacterized protein n=1 Tax=Gossypium mustelinum TaxID=34275 RepID=A0A5D2ZG82_GOSMU|nr:hypothetical protein E1A91_A05G358800v1 [Gossypium mustelinum]
MDVASKVKWPSIWGKRLTDFICVRLFPSLLHLGKFYTLLFRFLSSPLSQDLIPLRKIQNLNHHSLVLFNLRVRIFSIALKRRGRGRKRTNPIAGSCEIALQND